ncbi:acetyl-CoA hydrolase/transferase C-terminal domain-containing protein [Tranquillimonas rosea]|uniref:acetyl-CoA hydrolase/transferase C-terminal domain-containing protein n=1 Tax=Tranquillimonas rosea TaxID=641238 RepID=UPI003BAAE9C7
MAAKIIDRLGKDVRLGLPLGLGKPVTLLNALTRRAVADPSIRLSIFTALTLERPAPSSDMEQRFLGPAMDRLFGAYPQIEYARMLRDGTLPANIEVREFFFMAGRWLGVDQAQRNYISVNYVDALELLLAHEPNLVMQLVASDGDRLSLSCNTDISVDVLSRRRAGDVEFLFCCELNPELPFLGGDAAIPLAEADMLLEPPEPFELFSALKRPVGDTEHAIALHVSRLIPDGGTLQIGIGEIGDAVAHALLLRHDGRIAPIRAACPFPDDGFDESGPFSEGLYSVTEMLVDGLLQLFDAGVIKREVDGAAIHAGFFVESREFYARLREMPPDRRAKIAMKSVSFTNQLYGDETAKRAARRDARFVNAAMKATLLGAVVSDAREDGQVVSGVGGQHDFVSQAFALDGGRSVIVLPATRQKAGSVESNIVWSRENETLPRPLRDIVVTEYGIADLRGRTDAEAIAAMIQIADSRFQAELLDKAKSAGKIAPDYELPPAHGRNLPGTVTDWLAPFREDALPDFPFGSAFDATERRLLPALSVLGQAQRSRRAMLRLALKGRRGGATADDCLRRMGLDRAEGLRERVIAAALKGALREVERQGEGPKRSGSD